MSKHFIGVRGQVSPISLENIYPLLAAFIILVFFLAYIYSITSTNLEQRSVESMYKTAVSLANVMHSRSVFLYENKPGLFSSNRLDEYLNRVDQLYSMYKPEGFSFMVYVEDLTSGRTWTYSKEPAGEKTVEVAYPVAIRYAGDYVNPGIVHVKVWRK